MTCSWSCGCNHERKPSFLETFLHTLLSFNVADFKLNCAFFFFFKLSWIWIAARQFPCLWWISFTSVRASCLSGRKPGLFRSFEHLPFIWLNRFEMLRHTCVTQTLWERKKKKKQDNSFVSQQTHRGEFWLLAALTPHLHTLFWRGVSPHAPKL